MKNTYKPILFSTPMVQAILNGTKNQTRRTKGLELINENPDSFRYDGIKEDEKGEYYEGFHFFEKVDKEGNPTEVYIAIECPYAVGDIIWVRETFHSVHDAETDVFLHYGYKADKDYKGAKWKPSIFMPKQACRIFLKIKAIRAERLLDISREDAKKEGVLFQKIAPCDEYKDYMVKEKEFSFSNPNHTYPDAPTVSFFTLWESINGIKNLEHNDFVWVIAFEKIEQPNDFLV